MGHPTYQELLEQLVEVRDRAYRSDPEYREAINQRLESVMQALLEKLRDQFDPS